MKQFMGVEALEAKPLLVAGVVERRSHSRYRLACQLRLPNWTESIPTRDVSCTGFSFVTHHPIAPNSPIQGELILHDGGQTLVLRWSAQVVRAEALAEGRHLIGCRMDNYQVAHPNP